MRCGPSGIPCHPHGPRNGAEGAFPIDVDPEMAFREHRARGTAVMSRHAAPQSSKAGNIPFKPHHTPQMHADACYPHPEVRAAPARCMSTPRMDPRGRAGCMVPTSNGRHQSIRKPYGSNQKKGSNLVS